MDELLFSYTNDRHFWKMSLDLQGLGFLGQNFNLF